MIIQKMLCQQCNRWTRGTVIFKEQAGCDDDELDLLFIEMCNDRKLF